MENARHGRAFSYAMEDGASKNLAPTKKQPMTAG